MKKKPKEERDPLAVELGRRGAVKRWKTKTPAQKQLEMARVRAGKGRK